jgi:hypothetical protein
MHSRRCVLVLNLSCTSLCVTAVLKKAAPTSTTIAIIAGQDSAEQDLTFGMDAWRTTTLTPNCRRKAQNAGIQRASEGRLHGLVRPQGGGRGEMALVAVRLRAYSPA